MTGEGELVFNPPVTIKAFSTRDPNVRIQTNNKNGLDPEAEIVLLDQYLQAVCALSGDERVQLIYDNYKHRIHGQTSSLLVLGLSTNSRIIQQLLFEKYGPNSKEANTDPVVIIKEDK